VCVFLGFALLLVVTLVQQAVLTWAEVLKIKKRFNNCLTKWNMGAWVIQGLPLWPASPEIENHPY